MNALRSMSEKYGVKFDEMQIKKFSGLPSIGVDIKDLPRYINASENQRNNFQPQKGIPNDSLKNPQLKDWIAFAGKEAVMAYNAAKEKAEAAGQELKAEKPRYAIKCDAKTKYILVKDVVKTFTDLKIYQFNLITSLEEGGTVLDPTPK